MRAATTIFFWRWEVGVNEILLKPYVLCVFLCLTIYGGYVLCYVYGLVLISMEAPPVKIVFQQGVRA